LSPVGIAVVAFACILGGAVSGLLLGSKLPDHHLAADSKDVVRLSMAMIATLTALVLGLVTASAKSAFDAEDAAIKSTSASVLSLDRMLADYGPETKSVRDDLRSALTERIEATWPEDHPKAVVLEPARAQPGETIVREILALVPQSDAQQWYKARALELSDEILKARWIVFGGTESSVPSMFLIVIICWLTVLFGSFGLFAPRNATVTGALLICSLSVAASIFLILEMNTPFSGVMKISSAPMQYAVAHIDR
jgi:hypothetical protein